MSTNQASGNASTLDHIQQSIWQARVPLEIRLAPAESLLYDKSEVYMMSFPRLSYLPFLLPRLLNFYAEDLIADIETLSSDAGYFMHENVPLKWHLPVGLLYDIYVLSTQDVNPNDAKPLNRKAEPFRLYVHFNSYQSKNKEYTLVNPAPTIVHDSFINSVKEADFLRSGTAKPIMSLSADDSKKLWASTQDNDLQTYSRIHAGLLPKNPTPWRNIPLRIYLPSAPSEEAEGGVLASADASDKEADDTKKSSIDQSAQGHMHVIQSQVPPVVSATSNTAPTTSQLRMPTAGQGSPQTVGTALHTLLPNLFPSRRTYILAKPLLHGTTIPMNAILEEVASKACYADGWVNIVVAFTT